MLDGLYLGYTDVFTVLEEGILDTICPKMQTFHKEGKIINKFQHTKSYQLLKTWPSLQRCFEIL